MFIEVFNCVRYICRLLDIPHVRIDTNTFTALNSSVVLPKVSHKQTSGQTTVVALVIMEPRR